jgi:mono/diheme cytochrome c family protein
VSSRRVRLVVIPLVLFACFTGAAFALAELHLAKPGVPSSKDAKVAVGDPYRGETVFQQNCSSCHGDMGKEGGIGPRLQNDAISLAAAKSQIDQGGSVMPPNLVKGRDEGDVLAYLATIFAPAR